jgi:hypothetical protein
MVDLEARPLDLLRQVHLVRRDLADLELAALDAARAASVTWQSIAEVTGVTRSAAHQRHASLERLLGSEQDTAAEPVSPL